MKLQYNEGIGGCFPMHKDSTSATGRRLTVILYLSENWQKSQAGELRLYPFPLEPVDIAPHAGRLVAFSSVNSVHRVLPSLATRCSIQLFFSATTSNSHNSSHSAAGRQSLQVFPSTFPSWIDEESMLSLKFLRDEKLAYACKSALAKLSVLVPKTDAICLCTVTKILFDDEWKTSINDAFGSSPGVNVSLQLHRQQVEQMKSVVSSEMLGLLREALPLRPAVDVCTEANDGDRTLTCADDGLGEEDLPENADMELFTACFDDY